MKRRVQKVVLALACAMLASWAGIGAFNAWEYSVRVQDAANWPSVKAELVSLDLKRVKVRSVYSHQLYCVMTYQANGRRQQSSDCSFEAVSFPQQEDGMRFVQELLHAQPALAWKQMSGPAGSWVRLQPENLPVTIRHSPHAPNTAVMFGEPQPPLRNLANIALWACIALAGLYGVIHFLRLAGRAQQ